MKLLKNRESGQALVMALILLALGSLLIVPGLNLAITNLKYHQLIEGKTFEAYSADSGVQYALWELYNNPNESAVPGPPLPIVDFTINDRAVHVTAQYVDIGLYKITSTATSANGRSTTIESCVKLSVGIFAFAVAADDSMTLQNTIVESDSYPDLEGHIHSNADIELTDCFIYGNATAVETISGKEQVYGIPTEYSAEVTFPPDYAQLYEAMAKGPNGDNIHPGDLLITSDRELGPLYITGNLTVENATVILTGTVYVKGGIWVQNSNLDGDETVVAEEGNIDIEQGAFRSVIIPIIICLKVDGEIYLERWTIVDGVLYAPYGTVRFENVELYGAVGGKRVDIENSTIIYAKQLHGREDVPGGELAIITYSFR